MLLTFILTFFVLVQKAISSIAHFGLEIGCILSLLIQVVGLKLAIALVMVVCALLRATSLFLKAIIELYTSWSTAVTNSHAVKVAATTSTTSATLSNLEHASNSSSITTCKSSLVFRPVFQRSFELDGALAGCEDYPAENQIEIEDATESNLVGVDTASSPPNPTTNLALNDFIATYEHVLTTASTSFTSFIPSTSSYPFRPSLETSFELDGRCFVGADEEVLSEMDTIGEIQSNGFLFVEGKLEVIKAEEVVAATSSSILPLPKSSFELDETSSTLTSTDNFFITSPRFYPFRPVFMRSFELDGETSFTSFWGELSGESALFDKGESTWESDESDIEVKEEEREMSDEDKLWEEESYAFRSSGTKVLFRKSFLTSVELDSLWV